MITRINTIDEIKPIFTEYLAYICQFFAIADYDSWCEGALKNLSLYSIKNNRHIYIIKKSESIIGFAFVNKHLRFNTDGFAIAEFYIRKNYEKKGYGRRLAEHVFEQFPGNWEVAVALKNNSARLFWKQVLSFCTHDTFIEKRNSSFSGYGFLFNNA